MDKWVTVTKPTTRRAASIDNDNDNKQKKPTKRYSPYDIAQSKSRRYNASTGTSTQLEHGASASTTTLTKHLLSTLSDESNPITHSDIYERTVHVVSLASGHQRSERRSAAKTEYVEDRAKKIVEQRAATSPSARILNNVRVYINGYLKDTTDIEMKRVVHDAGGQILQTASRATHIITSHENLNASKTHKYLTSKSKNKPYVVKPEWVTDSIDAGKKLSERNYAVIRDSTTRDVFADFRKAQ